MFVFVRENKIFKKRLRTKTICNNRVFESLITVVVCNTSEFDCLIHRGYISIRVYYFWVTMVVDLIPKIDTRIDTRRGLGVQFLIPAPLWFELATIRGRREGEREERERERECVRELQSFFVCSVWRERDLEESDESFSV